MINRTINRTILHIALIAVDLIFHLLWKCSGTDQSQLSENYGVIAIVEESKGSDSIPNSKNRVNRNRDDATLNINYARMHSRRRNGRAANPKEREAIVA